ncbi:hypothetical protein [Sporolactobacillus sp. KGMB 08714]|uniref:hypothetical protein n=1 Tax=Sporolactobacillus sp. KGMB 08714 TaxID=3064704 RepID=UPI002FBDAA9E
MIFSELKPYVLKKPVSDLLLARLNGISQIRSTVRSRLIFECFLEQPKGFFSHDQMEDWVKAVYSHSPIVNPLTGKERFQRFVLINCGKGSTGIFTNLGALMALHFAAEDHPDLKAWLDL